MAEPSRVKVRRRRAHVRGDHRECLPRNCPKAGTVERDHVRERELRDAVELEFRDDAPRLAIARALVELAAGTGPAAVGAAVKQLFPEGTYTFRGPPLTACP